MTLDDLRALGWPLERVASAIGVHPRTLDGWLAGRVPSASAASHLASIRAITPAPTTARPHRVLIDVDAPPALIGRPPKH